MATNPRSNVSDRTNLAVVSRGRRAQRRGSTSLKGRLASTAIALLTLLLVVRFLPPGARTAQATAPSAKVAVVPADLNISDLQVSEAAGGEALYLDGLVSNGGRGVVTGATAEVEFHDRQGAVVGSVQEPLVGMAHGGTDLIRNEFQRNPVTPGEMRFFRVAVERVPPQWNHEVPNLKIVSVTSK